MKFKCDKCDQPATVHVTEIIGGHKLEKHLCEQCAIGEGITIKANVPISQLLEDFVLATTGDAEALQMKCEACGISFEEFRSGGMLGCPQDYDVFAKALIPMLERAHQGASQHVGKVPQHSDNSQAMQASILQMRQELKNAVTKEDYERAAALRDRIKQAENS